jgi:RimJ/RimL family protein N-acetyltransferase
MPETVPSIETPRLLLRGHRPEDFPACSALWSDPTVTHFIGGKPLCREDAWLRILRYVGHWQWLGFGFWAVEERSSGQFIGELGFLDYHRELDPPLHLAPENQIVPEIGWVLSPRFQGKGYATEGVRAALAWGKTHFSAGTRYFCLIDPDNAPSIRVAEKCHFVLSHSVSYRSEPSLLYLR